MTAIFYRDGYKYQLAEDYAVQIDIKPAEAIDTEYVRLGADGVLSIRKGYAWDGPSGPTVDTSDFMRGSLVHDALYQLMRGGYLDRAVYRERADNLLRSICLEDGMPHFRAEGVYLAVQKWGDPSSDPANERKVQYAPR